MEGMIGNVIGRDEINAYVYCDPSSGTPTIIKAKNVSSITDGGVGIHGVVFANALPSTNFTFSGSAAKTSGASNAQTVYENGSISRTTTLLSIRVSENTTARDSKFSLLVTGA